MRMDHQLRAAVVGLSGLLSSSALAAELPLWEIGAGVAAVGLPDYRGSDHRRTYFLPSPYLIYRGPLLKADREGVRASFFESDRLEINLSLNLAPVSGDEDNPSRQGMKPLRPMAELGPTADIELWRSSDGKRGLTLRLPVRAAVTLESSPRHAGWVFSPNLYWSARDPFGRSGWKFSLQAGPIVAARSHNAYFYSVRPEEAGPDRPAYAAPGGYAGAQAAAVLSKRFARHWIGAYARYDHLGGAVFNDSPLVRRRTALTAGIAVAWVFGVSSTTVKAED